MLAESIETEAQMTLLLQEGCNEMQGYLIGRPRSLATPDKSKRLPLQAAF